MHLTLHLTNQCNLQCKYCFVKLGSERMTREVALAAVKLGMEGKRTSGLLFYGGEPLLERKLIYDVVAHTQAIKEKTGHIFYYKMTTNGVLLDEDFLKFAQGVNLTIGFSHDGPAQDDCRLFHDGKGSYAWLEGKIPLLLKYQPYAIGMSVLDPATVHKASSIVEWLFGRGFKYVTVGVNYCTNAGWTKEHLEVLRGEYEKMAKLYIEKTRNEEKFYLSPFDMKILSHLKGEAYNLDRRRMAQNQLSVAPDGKLYSSSRFVGDPAMAIGDVFTGIDRAKQAALYEKGEPPAPCQGCAIRTRCNYAYDSLSRNGDEIAPDISPVQCAHEQLITPIADNVAETLYHEKSALFMHKHYNDMYPVVSLVEDRSA